MVNDYEAGSMIENVSLNTITNKEVIPNLYYKPEITLYLILASLLFIFLCQGSHIFQEPSFDQVPPFADLY